MEKRKILGLFLCGAAVLQTDMRCLLQKGKYLLKIAFRPSYSILALGRTIELFHSMSCFAGDAGLAISNPDLEFFFLNKIEFSMNYITSIFMDIYRILNH